MKRLLPNAKSLLDHYKNTASYEVYPSEDIISTLESLPRHATISVTCTSGKGIDHTIDTAIAISHLGFTVRPHIPARLVKDEAHLNQIVEKMFEHKIVDLFLIGGDVSAPAGKYSSSEELLEAIEQYNYHFRSIGIGGYPEGHPKIDEKILMNSLLEKQATAKRNKLFIISQLCFDAKKIVEWALRLKKEGIMLPISVGIPSYYNMIKLMKFAKLCGVGESLRFLSQRPGIGVSLSKQFTYNPENLLQSLVEDSRLLETAIEGIHVYTFNEFSKLPIS